MWLKLFISLITHPIRYKVITLNTRGCLKRKKNANYAKKQINTKNKYMIYTHIQKMIFAKIYLICVICVQNNSYRTPLAFCFLR